MMQNNPYPHFYDRNAVNYPPRFDSDIIKPEPVYVKIQVITGKEIKTCKNHLNRFFSRLKKRI